MKTLREMMDLIESAQTVAEFALSPEHDNDDLTDEAYKDGQRLGITNVDGMTLSQAFDLSRWDTKYIVPFSYGWKSGREFKIKHAKNDGVKLVLQKNGSLIRSREVDEEQLEETTDDAVAKVEQLFRDKR
jgi:hypothetical protein